MVSVWGDFLFLLLLRTGCAFPIRHAHDLPYSYHIKSCPIYTLFYIEDEITDNNNFCLIKYYLNSDMLNLKQSFTIKIITVSPLLLFVVSWHLVSNTVTYVALPKLTPSLLTETPYCFAITRSNDLDLRRRPVVTSITPSFKLKASTSIMSSSIKVNLPSMSACNQAM